jgi:Rrf2 family protein
MRISAKGEYAIKAVLDLAMHQRGELIPIQDIAARQGIPQRYLEQVLLALKRAGLLTSKRGSSGGYHLTRPPEEITVGAVLRAVEGGDAPFEVLGRRGAGYDLAELWTEIAEAVSRVIDGLTFGELAARVRERRAAVRSMYYI